LLPHIFEAFRQGSSGLSRTHGGVGLGLYIVARLLELLGGSITVRSDLGDGSIFCFRLPRSPRSHAMPLVRPERRPIDSVGESAYAATPAAR
jgi:signal transduction histidine kinase